MSVLLKLDPDSEKPLYQQLREGLEVSIAAGHFPDGSLPSSRELAAQLGVSRNTVNLAYHELVAEGFVTSHPRSGLTINKEIRTLLHQDGEQARDGHRPNWASMLTPIPQNAAQLWRVPADWYNYAYPFLTGQVALDAFPARDWLRAMRDSLDPANRAQSLQDSRSFDDPMLVHRLRTDVLPSRGINAEPEEILITSGSQQALHLTACSVIQRGARVAVENPGYVDAHVTFAAAGAELLPIPIDKSGMQMTRDVGRADLVYVTPSHQLPTCVTLSIARRRNLIGLANESDSLIVEDDFDPELRYRGRPTPALKALDEEDRVIYVGSFSKLLAPGLRLGFVVAAPELISHMRRWRRIASRHPPGVLQRSLALFLASGSYQRWLRRHRTTMKKKWERMNEAATEHLPWPVVTQTGGTGLWIAGPKRLDASVLAAKAARSGILFEHGAPFHVREPRPTNTLRLGFAAIGLERIEPGMEILGQAIRELPRRMHAR